MVVRSWGNSEFQRIERAFAPKGLDDSAQGFNPGNQPPPRCALKGHLNHVEKH
jgi:hypothetical protein